MQRMMRSGVALIAALALSAVVASAALAQPEFSKANVKFTTTSGKSVLKDSSASAEIKCAKDKGEGEITGKSTVSATVTFEECSGEVNKKACPSTISTEALTGQLGTVAATEAASGVGILFKPTGTAFAKFSCAGVNQTVIGSVAGEVTPTKTLSTEGDVNFTPSGTGMKIKKITTTKEEKPKLELGVGGTTSLESAETNVFVEAIEVK